MHGRFSGGQYSYEWLTVWSVAGNGSVCVCGGGGGGGGLFYV